MRARRHFASAAIGTFLWLCCAQVVFAGVNQLSGGRATPTSGTNQTVFIFSVSYQSSKGWAPQAVIANVAGKSVMLQLVSGTAPHGVYRGSSILPAGTWSVVFSASAAKGPNTTLAGPTLTVRAAKLAPTPAPKLTPTPAPKPLPKAISSPAATAASTTPPAHPTPARPAATRLPRSSSVAAAHSGPPPSKRPLPAVLTTHSSPSATPLRLGNGRGQPSQASASIALLLAVLAVCLLAAAGVLLLIGRRHRQPAEALQPVVQFVAQQPRSRVRRPDPAARGDDPILAAMGIGTIQSEEKAGDSPGDTAAPVRRDLRVAPSERVPRQSTSDMGRAPRPRS
jgi:hypothetical protein